MPTHSNILAWESHEHRSWQATVIIGHNWATKQQLSWLLTDTPFHYLLALEPELLSLVNNHTMRVYTSRIFISSVQSLSCVRLFVTPWTAACQASLSITNWRNLPKPIHWVGDAIQPSHLLSPPSQSFPASGSFHMSQFFASGGQNIGVSASTSVLPMNIQDWFPLGWTGWISLQSKELSRVLSNTTSQNVVLENKCDRL